MYMFTYTKSYNIIFYRLKCKWKTLNDRYITRSLTILMLCLIAIKEGDVSTLWIISAHVYYQ